MSEFIADHVERSVAISPDASFIIQAPAGSGKTELLIQRYLRLLSLVDAPEEIVAITFTRKAAAEMQSRILAAIQLAEREIAPVKDHEQQTFALATAALERDRKLNWHITDNPGRLRIQTIDSLCAGLTRQMPVISGLGAQPDTLDDATPLYEQAAINTLAELESSAHWSDAIARLLMHLDNDLPRVKTLITEMLAKRDQWLRYVAKAHERQDLERCLQNLIEEKLTRVCELFPDDLKAELCEIISFAAFNLKESKPDNPIVACVLLESLPGHTLDGLSHWRGISELLLTQKGDWRQRLNKSNGFPSPSENKAEHEIRSAMKTRVEGLIQRLRDVEGLHEALNTIKQLPPPNYANDEWEVVGALCQLLLLAEGQLRLLFADRNQMDFTGITHAAITALVNDDVPTDLALHLDYTIKHLLVDEYQDISINQFVLLERLTDGWSPGDGHTLFLVGDPMQSIYRFREAEVGIFINTWQQKRLGQVKLKPLRISTNFRSQPGIVEWVNTHFAHILPTQDDVITGAVSYEPSEAFHNIQPMHSVSVHPFFNHSGQQEATKVVDLIKNIRRTEPDSTTAVLVRSKRHLFAIIPALKEAGLRFQAIEIEGLGTQPAIQDLLALTRAYSHAADRIAWLAVLRAPWCGLELNALLQLVGQHKYKTVWQCLNDHADALDEQNRQRLTRFMEVFHDALEHKQRQALRQAIESLWLRLGGPATLENETDLENVNTFFECLEEHDHGGELEDLQSFLDSMEQLFAAPDNQADESLQLMSIHKAKGLEFDHVIIPALGRKTRSNQSELLMWLVRPRPDQEQDLILAPIKQAGQAEGPIYAYLKEVEKSKQAYEDTRLLYVAVTRAKQALHLLGHSRLKEDKSGQLSCEPPASSLLKHLWPAVKEQFEAAMSKSALQDHNNEITVVNQEWKRLKAGWSLPTPPETIPWQVQETMEQEEPTEIEFEWAGETIKHVGSVFHQAIQWIAEEGIEHWDETRILVKRPVYELALKQMGVPPDQVGWAASRVIEAVTEMIEDERGQWILDGKHKDAHNEYALSGVYNNRIINIKIDRTFVDAGGNRWIVDYKTSRHESTDLDAFLEQEQERYREQLEKYAEVMQGIDDRPIKLGLYFPLLRGWREW